MKSDFQLESQTHNNNFHIQLKGKFDGASAWELINTINDKHEKSDKIVVDTNQLVKIFPFGKLLLDGNLPHYIKRDKLFFSGRQADKLMPDGCRLIERTGEKEHKCKGDCKNCLCRSTQ